MSRKKSNPTKSLPTKKGTKRARRNRARKARSSASYSVSTLSKVSGASMSKAYRDYAEMVVNPCMGPLVRAPGIADGVNVVERQRVSLSLNSLGRTAGYLIWFPACQGADRKSVV